MLCIIKIFKKEPCVLTRMGCFGKFPVILRRFTQSLGNDLVGNSLALELSWFWPKALLVGVQCGVQLQGME